MCEVACTRLDQLSSALPKKCSIVLMPLWKEQGVTLTVFNQLCLLTVKGCKLIIIATRTYKHRPQISCNCTAPPPPHPLHFFPVRSNAFEEFCLKFMCFTASYIANVKGNSCCVAYLLEVSSSVVAGQLGLHPTALLDGCYEALSRRMGPRPYAFSSQ